MKTWLWILFPLWSCMLIATMKWEKKNRKPAKGNTQLHHANVWMAFFIKWKKSQDYTVDTRATIDSEEWGKEPGPSSSHESPISSPNNISVSPSFNQAKVIYRLEALVCIANSATKFCNSDRPVWLVFPPATYDWPIQLLNNPYTVNNNS